ncbi:glycosyltransferase [Desulfobacterales bacterium HSG16]|nr:glycosyltransferase [Desulfobacterales bacterium HSG16]
MSSKINILFVVNSMHVGGAERLAAEICKNVDKTRFNAMLCGLAGDGSLVPILEEAQVKYFKTQKKSGKDFSLPFKLRRIFRQNDIDIVHTHGQGPLLYTWMAMHLFPKPPKPLFVHSEHIDLRMEESSFPKAYLMNSVMLPATDAFVSIAEHLALVNQKDFKTIKNRITTIPNGIDVRHYESSGKNKSKMLHKELNLKPDTRIIGNISVLRPQKDHGTLVLAMKDVAQSVPNAVCVIAGAISEAKSELERLTLDLGIEKSVRFLGYRQDVPELLECFDMFVLPSLYEGLPLCLLEAGACGLPIVTTDVPGNNEFVQHGYNGLLAPPRNPEQLAQCIIRVLTEDGLSLRLGKNSRKKVEQKHEIGRMINYYNNFYERIYKKK